MPNNIGPKIGVDGEKEFRSEINAINNSLKTMGAEMGAVTSAFIGNEKSVEALTAKNELLQAKFDELSKKADVQKARLKELDDAGVDPTSASYQKLLQDLYKTQTEMNKTEAEIKDNQTSMDNLGKETDEAAESMDKGAKSSKRFGDNLKANLVSEAIIAGVKALGDGLKKIGSSVLDAAAAADDLATLATKTGITTDELQKLQYAAGTVDVDVETVAGAMGKLSKNMADAATGSGAAAEAFAALGIQIQNDDGTFRDRNEIFQETIAALGQIPDEVERDAAAMDIFGKSATDLNPLILGGAEALQEMGDHAQKAGLILSKEAVGSLATLNDRVSVLKGTATAVGQQFLASFAGPITEAIDQVIEWAEKLATAFQEGGISELASTAGEIATEVASVATEQIPKIAEFATKCILTLTEGLISMLPDIVESAISIITTLVNQLTEMLPELIPVAVQAILDIVDTLTNPESIGKLVDAAIQIVLALANGLIDALPSLLEKAPVIIANLVTAIIENVPKLIEAAFEAISTLAKGIIDNLPEIGKAAGEIVTTVVSGLAELWAKMVEVGGNIVGGIWQGIQNMASWLWEKVSGFFSGIVDGVKDVLGIASPSKVFATIGDQMAAGVGVGFDRTMADVERDIQSSIPTSLGLPTAVGGSAAYGGGMASGTVEEITIPVNVGGVELARVLYRHIVGEGQRIGAAMVT